MNNTKYGKVFLYTDLLTQDYNDFKIIDDEVGLANLLSIDKKGMAEVVGGENQQVKPFFDLDCMGEDIDIKVFIGKIQNIFPNKKIKWCKRKPRPYNGKMKYSYRVYVSGVKISSSNIEIILQQNGLINEYGKMIDLSVYSKNRRLYMPLTKYKYDRITKKNWEVPKLELGEDASLFDCCASYIE